MLDILDPDQEVSFDELEGTPSESIIDTSQVLFYSFRPKKTCAYEKVRLVGGNFFFSIYYFILFFHTNINNSIKTVKISQVAYNNNIFNLILIIFSTD